MGKTATTVPDTIAGQLSALFGELVHRESYSRLAAVSLAQADASGRAIRLFIFQCDSNDLVLLSILRRCWDVYAEGYRRLDRWPLTEDMVQSGQHGVQFPYVRFATDGLWVRFGMRFGPSSYVAREGPLLPNGEFDSTALVDPYSRADPNAKA